MTLPASGPISFSDIQSEMGGQNPISLGEYYRNAGYTSENNTGVPTSGAISAAQFHGTQHHFYHTITSSVQEGNLRTILLNEGWNTISPVQATIDTAVYMWSDDTSTAGLTISGAFAGGLTLTNKGNIIGRGGDGGISGVGQAGGPALSISATGVTLNNNAGAYIAGGGGGGSRSWWADLYSGGSGYGGGGAGGGYSGGVAGGAIGQAGGDGSQGYGGGAGGEGSSLGSSATGGAGGRVLPGVGGDGKSSGGAGGSAGNPGQGPYGHLSGEYGGGGGGWGAAGGGGAAGGAAITASEAYTFNNTGTVYGATS